MENSIKKKKTVIQLINDNFENGKRYGIPHAQLIMIQISRRAVRERNY